MAERSDNELVKEWIAKVHAKCIDDGGCLIWSGATYERSIPRYRYYDGSHGSLRRNVFKAFGNMTRENHAIIMTCGSDKCLNPEHMKMKPKKDVLINNLKNMNPVAVQKRARINRERNGVLGYENAEYVRNSDELGTVLAKRFGVSTETISQARQGKTWIRKENNPFAGLMK